MLKNLFGNNEADELEKIISMKEELITKERCMRLHLENEVATLTAEVARLQTIIDIPKPHNERNAGRKTRFTYEVRSIIEIMYYGNKGVAAIIKALEEETGELWSRSTINYYINTYLQNHK